jgi:hypothetical protein
LWSIRRVSALIMEQTTWRGRSIIVVWIHGWGVVIVTLRTACKPGNQQCDRQTNIADRIGSAEATIQPTSNVVQWVAQ